MALVARNAGASPDSTPTISTMALAKPSTRQSRLTSKSIGTGSGGLKARGHPVGATGMYQVVEVVQQLRGECNRTQVDGARVGMAQNIGGSGATILTHILKVD